MTRRVCLLLVGLICAVCASGQVPQRPNPAPPPAPAQKKGLEGEAKLRWVCKRLQLDAPQSQQVEALITVYQAELGDAERDKIALLRRMQEKLAEVDRAKADGNQDEVRKLQAELQGMGPEASTENNFFKNLEQVLTDEQKTKLPQLREQVKTTDPDAPPTGAGELRPAHILKAVRELPLTPEQGRQLEGVLEDFRNNLRGDPPKQEADFAERAERFIKIVRPILTPQQAGQFDKKIDDLRKSAPAAQAFHSAVAPTSPVTPPPSTPVPPPPTPPK